MNSESVARKEELQPGVFIKTSLLCVRISWLPYSCCIVIKFFLLQQSLRLLNNGNLKSVHQSNLYLNTYKGSAEKLTGFLISIFVIVWSTEDVPEGCGN